MRIGLILIISLTTAVPSYSAEPVDSEKLRKLLKFPPLYTGVTFHYHATRGFYCGTDKRDVSAEIAKAEKELREDQSNADRYAALGSLYNEQKDKAKSKEYFVKAAALYRQQLASKAHGAEVHVAYAIALKSADEREEAERVLRKLVLDFPQNWQCWAALGDIVYRKSWALLSQGKSDSFQSQDPAAFGAFLAKHKVSPEIAKPAEQLLEEAVNCYDRAVAFAPNEPRAYLERASFYMLPHGWSRAAIGVAYGKPVNGMTFFMPPAAAADIRKAADLFPSDYKAIGAAAYFTLISCVMQNIARFNPNDPPANLLSAELREWMTDAIDRAEKLARGSDPASAAGAAEVAGDIHALIFHDFARAEPNFRRAIELDKSRDHSWDSLAAIVAKKEQYLELITLCQQRLECQDNVWNRTWLATAYDLSGQSEKAEREVRQLLTREPEGYLSNMAMAVLLLKRNDVQNAANHLGRAYIALASQTRDRHMHFHVTHAIFLALRGDVDAARNNLRQLLQQDQNNKDAKAVLEALGGRHAM